MKTEKLVLLISDIKKDAYGEVEQYYGGQVSLTYVLQEDHSTFVQFNLPTAVYEKIKPIIKVLNPKSITKGAKNETGSGKSNSGSNKAGKGNDTHRNGNGPDAGALRIAGKGAKKGNNKLSSGSAAADRRSGREHSKRIKLSKKPHKRH
jgi:hypothetical protein